MMSWVWAPIFELIGADVEFAVRDLAEQHILRADAELAGGIAHRRRTVAAAARLMEYQRAVLRLRRLRRAPPCR